MSSVRIAMFLLLASARGMPPPAEKMQPEAFDVTNLNAGAADPLFTTYCADLTHARYDPDQGYHFRFYDSERPVAFISAQDGDWGVAFVRDRMVVVTPADYARAPVIEESWPDFLRYVAEPFDGLSLTGRFEVRTSSLAIWELVLRNTGGSAITVQVAPYLNSSLSLLPEPGPGKVWSFRHEHPADGWTVDKQIPQAFTRSDRLSMNPAADTLFRFAGVGGESAHLPEWVLPDQAQVFPVYGRIADDMGRRLDPSDTPVQAYAFLEHDPRTLISMESPLHESSWQWWRQRGYYALELGELPWAARAYSAETGWRDLDSNTVRIVVSAPERGLASMKTLTRAVPLAPGSNRGDFALGDSLPAPPKHLAVAVDTFGLRLSWEGDPHRFYRVFWLMMMTRFTPQERDAVESRNDEFKLAGARPAHQFKYLGQTQGTSFDIDLRPRIQGPDGSAKVPVAYDAGQDPFARLFIVTAVTDALYPGPASETLVCWPDPTLENAVTANSTLQAEPARLAPALALLKTVTLKPGESDTLRMVRETSSSEFEFERNRWLLDDLAGRSLDELTQPERDRFAALPDITLPSRGQQLLCLSALNLLRQCMLPPEGQLDHNYYVFSREPSWGWGHGGQVFHESLAMLAYGLLDPRSAQESMRVFQQVQFPADGNRRGSAYIPYRAGPYLNEVIETNGGLTSSGPFYSWITLELFKLTGDREFLKEMYPSCKQFVEFWQQNRDTDHDGLYEWGGHAVLESLRDASVAVWDQVAPPDSLEDLDLNCMLVNELCSLSAMADTLGDHDAASWLDKDGAELAYIIQRSMWDDSTGFFYHNVKRGWPGTDNHPHGYAGPWDNQGNLDPERFSFSAPGDLKRREIVGFLPLWAGIATEEQAKRLVGEHLTNPDEFWRSYGVPSLSADDPYYNPKGYWNGPVWVQWNYLIVRGLLRYGYVEEARELTDRVCAGMNAVLANTHTMWEFYSPDEPWGGWHQTYIWAGIVARMMMDVYGEDSR